MFLSIAYAMSQPQAAQGQAGAPNLITSFAPLALIFIIFYFLLIRPQQKKQKEQQDMLNSLKKNDEVITSGGIHGTIVNVKEKTYTLRVDDNVKIEISKTAVAGLKKKTQGE